jgi:hypothetical protein
MEDGRWKMGGQMANIAILGKMCLQRGFMLVVSSVLNFETDFLWREFAN